MSNLIQVGWHVLRTSITEKSKKVIAQLGNAITQTVSTDNADWIQHVGIITTPSEPETTGERRAAYTVVLRTGDRDIVIGSQDFRGMELAGAMKAGESCLYAGGRDGKAQARVLLKGDGSINLFTKKGNVESGTGLGLFINPNGDGSVTIMSSEGAAVQLGADGSASIFNANAAVSMSKDGRLELVGKQKVDISAPAVTIGGLAAQPLASGPQVVAAIGALQTEISALSVAVTALGGLAPLVSNGGPAAASPAAAAVVTGTTALGTITPIIPTKRLAAD